jgi:hypothetical protein
LPDTPLDWARGTLIGMGADRAWSREPDIADWLDRSRLNMARGLEERSEDAQVQRARRRLKENAQPGLEKLARFLG